MYESRTQVNVRTKCNLFLEYSTVFLQFTLEIGFRVMSKEFESNNTTNTLLVTVFCNTYNV